MTHDSPPPPRPRVPHPVRATAWAKIEKWLEQAVVYARSGLEADKPDDRLLLEAVWEWRPPWLNAELELHPHPLGAYFSLMLPKPKGDGTTKRFLDPAALALLLVALVAGGSLLVEAHGNGGYFLTRVIVSGDRTRPRADKQRRTYLSRCIYGTTPGVHQKENPDYHSLLRRDAAGTRARLESEPVAIYGAADLRADAIERFREVLEAAPEKLPAGLTEARYAELLDIAFAALQAIPLGNGDTAAAT